MREMEEPQRDIEKFRAECTDDALAMAMSKIKKVQDANNFLQDELTALGDECSSLDQEFKKVWEALHERGACPASEGSTCPSRGEV